MPDTCLTPGELGFCDLGWQVPQGSCLLLLKGPAGQKQLISVLREHGVHCLSVQKGGLGGSGLTWNPLGSLNKAAFSVQETPSRVAEEKGVTELLWAWLAAGDGPAAPPKEYGRSA